MRVRVDGKVCQRISFGGLLMLSIFGGFIVATHEPNAKPRVQTSTMRMPESTELPCDSPSSPHFFPRPEDCARQTERTSIVMRSRQAQQVLWAL